ncbi:MAG: peptide chain release factor N(5)-glutamine methyltransferase [Bacilli bacterium]|nr:peptide chain release factor N(5)-glutamine methyltransferase [Bacilli bacterium]MDD4733636.1 peptide chain release factor N(5)-glutamine methyltransferase [Bacilli bacterium]
MNKLIEYGIKELEQFKNASELATYLFKYIENKDDYKEGIKKIKEGHPIQYVVGNVDFYGLNFVVNPNVLIPRFETEGLIEKTLQYINKDNISIVDIGTGSGCIAITLKKKLPNSNITAIDISDAALEVAKLNAYKNDCEINFIKGNLIEELEGKYDLIISNPPYIGYDEEVMEMVKKNEPPLALYASNDGLDCYIRILKKVHKHLNKKSLIAFEIGEKQGLKIKKIAKRYLPFSKVTIEKDLQGKDRYIFIKNNFLI